MITAVPQAAPSTTGVPPTTWCLLTVRRGLFIISPTGILRQMTINDLPVGRDVDETLRLVKAFQVRYARRQSLPAAHRNIKVAAPS